MVLKSSWLIVIGIVLILGIVLCVMAVDPDLAGLILAGLGYILFLIGVAIGSVMVMSRNLRIATLFLSGVSVILIGAFLIWGAVAFFREALFQDSQFSLWFFSGVRLLSVMIWGFLGLSLLLSLVGWAQYFLDRRISGRELKNGNSRSSQK